MARRPTFAADTPAAALREWIAGAIREAFTTPRVLPTLRRPPPEPVPMQPPLFEGLPEQHKGDPPPAMPDSNPDPAPRKPPPAGMPLDAVMRAHFAGVISGPSELALKRRRLRDERTQTARGPPQI